MTQKEKLINLIEKHCDDVGYVDCKKDCTACLADYLIKNGVVVLPAKIGDTVYLLGRKCKLSGSDNKPWKSCPHYWDNVYHRDMWGCAGIDTAGNHIKCGFRENEMYVKETEFTLSFFDFNKNAKFFPTREEAERALAERREDEEDS